MNKVYLFLLVFVLSINSFAQTAMPSSFNVQFSLRRTNGTPNPNKALLVKATIFKNTSAIYEKIFSEISNPFGIVSLKVESASASSQFPSASDFANNNLSLSISVDTTNIGGNFFDIYTQQLFAAVPYAIAAKKAPGTLEYQYNDDEAGDPTKGINNDVLFQNDTTDANFFPRLFFNKKSNTWSPTANSYSLLPNKLANVNRTIFFDVTQSPNLKPRWVINQALTMNNAGLGINMPSGAAPSKALEVFGDVRFASLNTTGTNRMVVVDVNGNLINQAIPSVSGSTMPLGFNQGDMIFFDSVSTTWKSTNDVRIYNNNLYAENDVFVDNKIHIKDLDGSGEVRFNAPSLLNPVPIDSTRFLTTDITGKLLLHKVKFPISAGSLSPGTQGDLLFFNNGVWSPNSALKIINNSLVATKNISVADTLFSNRLTVSNDVIFNNVINPKFLDSSQFLTTDPNGKVVLQKVKIPTTVNVLATTANKFIAVSAANQSYNLNDTTIIFINHGAINPGTYSLNLPLAGSFPNRQYEVYFKRPLIGLKPSLQFNSNSALSNIYNFKTSNSVIALTETSSDNLKVILTSTFISPALGFMWVLVVQKID